MPDPDPSAQRNDAQDPALPAAAPAQAPASSPALSPAQAPSPSERTLVDGHPAAPPPLNVEATTATAQAERTVSDGQGAARQPTPTTLALNATSLAKEDGPTPRFTVAGTLGQGATSAVWLAHDRDFDRDVAIKYLAPAAGAPGGGPASGRFLREARVTARLEHPNIVPVHDLGESADGGLYMVMRCLTGRSLGDRIRAAAAAGKKEVEAVSTVVTLFLKLCDALAYAHSKGVLHRDIKPDNIMLGDFGEVVLVDWGTAIDHVVDAAGGKNSAAKSLVGTPAYMSPEQARGEAIGPPGDIYCLGASLFHTLLLRHPLFPTDKHEDYWRRKCLGDFDQPDAAEIARVPRQLLAITLKAMAADPARRYATVSDLASDLQKWQSGLAVSAFRDPWTVRLGRWHRRHAWLLWPLAAVVAISAGTTCYLYAERLKEFADWGRPIADEDFHDDSWTSRWANTVAGSFVAEGGHVVSQNERGSVMFFKQRLAGKVALEYDARCPAGTRPGDMSAVWTEGNVFATAQPKIDDKSRWIWIQAGAFDNVAATIISYPGDKREAYHRLALAPDRWHHVRITIDGTHMEQQIDGQVVSAYDAVFALSSGFIGLYGYFPGKQFANVRIWNKGVAQKVSVIEIGDTFYQDGYYDQAATQYQRIVDSQPGTAVAEAATYRLGLCRLVQGRWDDAATWWSRVRDPALQLQVRIHQLDHLASLEKYDDLIAAFTPLYDGHAELRVQLRNHWRDWVVGCEFKPLEALLPLVRLYADKFPNTDDTNDTAWLALSRTGEFDRATTLMPDDRGNDSVTMIQQGHSREVVAKYPDLMISRCTAFYDLGENAAALELAPAYEWIYRPLLLSSGHEDRYVSEFGQDIRIDLMHGRIDAGLARPDSSGDLAPFRCAALLLADRGDEALALNRTLIGRFRNDGAVRLLVWMGRSHEALDQAFEWEGRHVAHAAVAIDAAVAGNLIEVHQECKTIHAMPYAPFWAHAWFGHDIVLPYLDNLGKPDAPGGETGAIMASLRDLAANGRDLHHQQPWYFARLVLGQVSEEEFLKQPFQPACAAMLKLGIALRHDLAGDLATAVAGYREWLALPRWQRGIDGVECLGDPLMERFVLFRLKGAQVPAVTAPAVTAPVGP